MASVAPVQGDSDGGTAGRRIPGPGSAGDTGGADPVLAAARVAFAADGARRPEVLAAMHSARVLAPVVALLGETGTGPTGLPVDKTADIVLPLLDDGSGHRAVPVFSCLAEMTRWDPAARPVPVDGPRAAAVALAEGAEGLVLDVAGPHPVVLGPAELQALVDGRGTVPAYDDDELAALLSGVLAAEPQVMGAWIRPVVGVDARLTVALAPGADPGELGGRLGERLRALVDRAVHGIDLEMARAGGAAPAGRPLLAEPSRD